MLPDCYVTVTFEPSSRRHGTWERGHITGWWAGKRFEVSINPSAKLKIRQIAVGTWEAIEDNFEQVAGGHSSRQSAERWCSCVKRRIAKSPCFSEFFRGRWMKISENLGLFQNASKNPSHGTP